MEKIAQQFIMGAVKVFLYLILVLTLLSIIGIEVTGIITALSALILAVGMALQNNIANLANGIIIVSTKMFKKGDFITVGSVSGSITDINFFFTTLTTPDNKKVTLPNNTIVNSEVTNAGANKTRRVDWTFSVAYESDVEQVKKIILDVMNSNGKIYVNEGKKPFCRLKTLGASSIDFFANCWCDSEDYWDVYYYVVESVYNEFKKNDISVPFAQLEVRNRTDKVVMPFNKEALPERVEKVRSVEEGFDLETADLTKIFHKKKNAKAPSKYGTK
jgi:small conductance mechanosensitive channel